RKPVELESPIGALVEDAWPVAHVEVRRRPAESVWMVISGLRELGPQVVGDGLRFSVACEGPACAVRAALELSFVTRPASSASQDEPMTDDRRRLRSSQAPVRNSVPR